VNTDHELSYHGEFFPCSIFLSYLILRQDKSIIWKMGMLQDTNG